MEEKDKKTIKTNTETENEKNFENKSLEPKERVVSLNDIAEEIYKKVYSGITLDLNKILKSLNSNLGSITYRLFSLELILYKLIKEGKIDKDILNEILLQEDILTSNVETMLKKIEEVKLKNKEAIEDLEEKNKEPKEIKEVKKE
jgi:hypothetical protein